MFNLNNIPIPVSPAVSATPEPNKNFPTVGLKNILQNSDLLDLLLKPMSNSDDQKEKEAPIPADIESSFTSDLCSLNFDDFLPQNKPVQSDHDYLDYNAAKVNDLLTDGPSKNYESAFLGQKLWSNDEIFQGEKFGVEYLGIEEFLNENLNETDMQFLDGLQSTETPEKPQAQNEIKIPPKTQMSKLPIMDSYELQTATVKMKDDLKVVKNLPEIQPSISSLISKLNEDDDMSDQEELPNKRFFEERLTLQPTLKKSKKQFVPNEMKDEKYWARRKKNNVAAKRSRDTRRFKENQIVIAATYLEHENETLRKQLEEYKKMTTQLQTRLSRYEPVDKI